MVIFSIMASKTKAKNIKATHTVARSDDGTIQINFTIPYTVIVDIREKVVKDLAKEIDVPGFRKGKAPLNKVVEHVPQAKLTENVLSQILPEVFSNVVTKEKLNPIIVPRFELISSEDKKDWQVRAITCEKPNISLNDYKDKITGAIKSKTIWTPGKDAKQEKPKESSKEEKEQEIIKLLLESIKVKVPKILIEEEVNSKLSQLLQRLEKLGLNLESYLASIGKTPQSIRKEYEENAKNSISMEFILNEIALKEEIKVPKSKIDDAINASGSDPKIKEKLDTPEQRRIIEDVLRKRAVLDFLVALV